MAGPSHRIGELRLDLRAPDAVTAVTWGRAVQAMAEDRLLPLIEAAFDRLAPQDVRHFDRIELDLGRLGPDPGSLGPALDRALAAALAGQAGRGMGPGPDDAAPGATGLIATYLRRGGVPLPDPAEALRAAWAAVAALPPAGRARALARLAPLCAEPAAARRLLASAPAGLLSGMVLAPGLSPAPRSRSRDGAAGSEEVLAALAALALAPDDTGRLAALAAALDGPMPPTAPPQSAPPQTGKAAPLRIPPRPAVDRTPGEAAADPETPPVEAAPRPPVTRRPADADGSLPLAVPAAGLVILYPFLAPYLDRFGLLSGPGHLAGDPARSTAVRLAQRLATGDRTAPEPNCVLAKILCGIDPAEALWPEDPTDPDPDRVAAEAEALLSAVIGHWAKLGRSSPEGLREGFLRRPGLVRRREDGWLLQVERRGTDILLDSLPWTLGLVRTPFMAGLLRVDWR